MQIPCEPHTKSHMNSPFTAVLYYLFSYKYLLRGPSAQLLGQDGLLHIYVCWHTDQSIRLHFRLANVTCHISWGITQ